MTQELPRYAKLFTVREANAMLPLVRAIATDMSSLAREVVERRERLSLLMGGREQQSSDPFTAELQQIEEELDADKRRLNEYLEELLELGVEPKNGIEGLVDFPGIVQGRLVYLCWKVGEPSVQFWHDLDAGFAGRQPLLPEPVVAE